MLGHEQAVSTAFKASGRWPCIGHQIKCKTTHCQSSGSRPYHHRPMLHQAANGTDLAGFLLSDPQILSLRSSTKIMPPEESYRPYVHVIGSGAVPYQGCRACLMQHGSPEHLQQPTIRTSTSFSKCVISCVGTPHHLWLNILTGGLLMMLRAAESRENKAAGSLRLKTSSQSESGNHCLRYRLIYAYCHQSLPRLLLPPECLTEAWTMRCKAETISETPHYLLGRTGAAGERDWALETTLQFPILRKGTSPIDGQFQAIRARQDAMRQMRLIISETPFWPLPARYSLQVVITVT